MAWETALDRLLLQQVHRAATGESRAEEVKSQIQDLIQLAPDRPESAFHVGYARVMLGLESQEPRPDDEAARRWHTLGRLRGHEKRGERHWIADLLSDPSAVLDLLREPRIAMQCLPLAMRTLFWSGDLALAVRAIDYLATADEEATTRDLVDAALADLLTRLRNREDEPSQDTTLSILQKCLQLSSFGRLPDDVRAGYLHETGRRLQQVSEFEDAIACYEQAMPLADDVRLQRSRIAVDAALATMRLHSADEIVPQSERPERVAASEWLSRGGDDEEKQAPEALFTAGILLYEQARWEDAARHFDACTRRFRRATSRDQVALARTNFFLAASILAGGNTDESSRALRLMESALGDVKPDLESFYSVHEALKQRDRKLALRFLDAVDMSRGTAPDQFLFVALEYLSLGEADPAIRAADQVLQVAVDLDQRVEAMRVLLTAHNMRGDRNAARAAFDDVRELLVQRGKFHELEKLLLSEDFVGQALDHLEIKCELVNLYEEMEDREVEKATLQSQIARSLRARKDQQSLQEAFAILQEVEIAFPDMAREEMNSIGKLLALADASPTDLDASAARVALLTSRLGRKPRVLVVGGNERQRRHHHKFEQLARDWGFDGEWLMANYTSPQKLVSTIGERLLGGIDVLMLLHWNRHETTEPALDLARKASVPARTVHYAGFTSLQVALAEVLEKYAGDEPSTTGTARGRR